MPSWVFNEYGCDHIHLVVELSLKWKWINISCFLAMPVLVLFENLQNVAEIHVGKPPYTQVHYVTSGFLHVSR